MAVEQKNEREPAPWLGRRKRLNMNRAAARPVVEVEQDDLLPGAQDQFAIRDRKSGALLFLGRIADPARES